MTTISIKYVDFPKPGKKNGKLTTTTGQVIMCTPDRLDKFRAGMTYDVQLKEQTWFQGQPNEQRVTIIADDPSPAGHTGPVQGQDGQAGYQRPAQNQAPYRPNTGFQPRIVQGGGRPSDFDPAKDLHIFVTGVVQQAMNSGKFTASEIPVLTQAAIEAYDRLLARVQGKPSSRPGIGAPPVPPPPDTYTADLPLDELGDPGPAELQ